MTTTIQLFDQLKKYIDSLEVATISEERKQLLQPLVEYIQGKIKEEQPILLNFICTHNSRRSHLAQVWAKAMSLYYKVEKVECFSGGTAITALYPMVVEVLKSSGFDISILEESKNPHYKIQFASEDNFLISYSKLHDDKVNPSENFAAIMTCSQADEACPLIFGAEKRIPITYEDPKISDGTPEEKEHYTVRSTQIATEMKYVFSKI